MQHEFAGWFYGVIGLGVVETLVYYAAPQLLARAAFWPIGMSRDALISRALLDKNQTESRYRSAARAGVSLAQLPLPTTLDGDDTVGRWEGDHGWLRATTKWFGWKRSLGVARLQAEIRGDRVHLDAKAYPMPLSLVFILPVFLFGFPDGAFPVLFAIPMFLAIIGVNWYGSVRRIRGDVEAALMRIAADIEQPRRF